MSNTHSTAYLDGWLAHKSGNVAVEENPYHEDKQSRSHSEWMSGWGARFNACKHGGDLSLDEELY